MNMQQEPESDRPRNRRWFVGVNGKLWGELAEMELFPTKEQATQAKRRVYLRMIGRWTWIKVVVFAVVISLFMTVVLRRFVNSLGLGISETVINLVLMVPTSLGVSVLGVWMLNRHVSMHLRRELIQCGVPVCLGCGYHLAGTLGDVCPECGREIDEEVARLIGDMETDT